MNNLHIDKINFIRWNTVDGKRGLKDLLVEVYGDCNFKFENTNHGYYLHEVNNVNFNEKYLTLFIKEELDDMLWSNEIYIESNEEAWLCDLCRKGYIEEGLYILDN